jgi:hypothetical protein
MVSVDHAGKLFERIEANAPAGHDKRYRNTNTGMPPHPASFCPRHGNHPVQGAFRKRSDCYPSQVFFGFHVSFFAAMLLRITIIFLMQATTATILFLPRATRPK